MDTESKPMIHACLFDMGNVLVHFSHEKMFQQMAAVCGCDAIFLKDWLFASGRLLRYERGEISDDELHQQIELLVGKTIDQKELRFAASDIFSVNKEIIPLLESLKQKEMPLVLLSNTSCIHFEFIRSHFSILDYFDSYVLSYEAKLLKPEPEIFKLAASQANTLPEHCFFTDDIQENITAAQKAGLHATQFQNAKQISAVLHQLLGKK